MRSRLNAVLRQPPQRRENGRFGVGGAAVDPDLKNSLNGCRDVSRRNRQPSCSVSVGRARRRHDYIAELLSISSLGELRPLEVPLQRGFIGSVVTKSSGMRSTPQRIRPEEGGLYTGTPG